jgi:hypothetical protein
MGNSTGKLSAPRSKVQKFTSVVLTAALTTSGAYFTFLQLKLHLSRYLKRIAEEKLHRQEASRLLAQVQRNTVLGSAELVESFLFPFLQSEFDVEQVQNTLKLTCYASSEDLLIAPSTGKSDRKAIKIKHWETIKSLGFQRSFALIFAMPLICLAIAVQNSLVLRENAASEPFGWKEGIVRGIREISSVVFEHFAK